MDVGGEARLESRIELQHFVHLLFVASENHHCVATHVLWEREIVEQLAHSFMAKGALSHFIGFIDKENATTSLLHLLVHSLASVAHVSSNQIVSARFHSVLGGNDPIGKQDASNQAGHCGFPRSRSSSEHI